MKVLIFHALHNKYCGIDYFTPMLHRDTYQQDFLDCNQEGMDRFENAIRGAVPLILEQEIVRYICCTTLQFHTQPPMLLKR